MKRSPMPRRRRPMKRDGTVGQKIARAPDAGIPPLRRAPHPKANGDDPSYRQACAEVDARSGGYCEGNVVGVCKDGRHWASHHHHVVLRSQGGPDVAWNLLHLCFPLHEWVHANPAEARERGLIRRRGTR